MKKMIVAIVLIVIAAFGAYYWINMHNANDNAIKNIPKTIQVLEDNIPVYDDDVVITASIGQPVIGLIASLHPTFTHIKQIHAAIAINKVTAGKIISHFIFDKPMPMDKIVKNARGFIMIEYDGALSDIQEASFLPFIDSVSIDGKTAYLAHTTTTATVKISKVNQTLLFSFGLVSKPSRPLSSVLTTWPQSGIFWRAADKSVIIKTKIQRVNNELILHTDNNNMQPYSISYYYTPKISNGARAVIAGGFLKEMSRYIADDRTTLAASVQKQFNDGKSMSYAWNPGQWFFYGVYGNQFVLDFTKGLAVNVGAIDIKLLNTFAKSESSNQYGKWLIIGNNPSELNTVAKTVHAETTEEKAAVYIDFFNMRILNKTWNGNIRLFYSTLAPILVPEGQITITMEDIK